MSRSQLFETESLSPAQEIKEEFNNILETMSSDQIAQMLEDFTPSMVAMDSAQEFHLLNASSEDVMAECREQLPSLLSLNFADFLNDAPATDVQDDEELPMEWPAFEPVVAPRITTVDAFLKETLRTASELIGCAEDPTEREQEMQTQIEDCSVPVQIAEETGEGWGALAEALIDAANHAVCPNRPQSSALIPSVPISGRRIMVAQMTGKKGTAEFEESLRSLFSEKC